MPDTVASRIVAIARQFLWESKQAKVAWKDLCLPKEDGGLGIRDLDIWNTALLAKLLWNIHAKADSLWIQWIHSEIIRNSDFWDWQPRLKVDSPLIKHVISIRDDMLTKCSRQETSTLLAHWSNTDDTKAAYECLWPRDGRHFWAKYVWKDFNPPKYSFVCWLAIRWRISTRDRITWDEVDTTCALCSIEDENADHLFFKCTETLKVWSNIWD